MLLRWVRAQRLFFTKKYAPQKLFAEHVFLKFQHRLFNGIYADLLLVFAKSFEAHLAANQSK